jgi:hypothetical protein
MLRRLLKSATGALGLFHLWLFARQAWTGELGSPDTILKWIAAAALVAALVALRRAGVPLARGRKAVAIWTLVALLHAPAVGERLSTFDTPGLPETAIALTQVVVSLAPMAGALFLLWLARTTVPRPSRASQPAAAAFSPRRLARASFAFAPRPPPSV